MSAETRRSWFGSRASAALALLLGIAAGCASSVASKISNPGIAVISCALTGLIFDGVRASLLGDLGPAGYTVLVAVLTLAMAGALSFAARGLSIGAALSGWLFFEVVVRFGVMPTAGIPLAIATLGCVLATTRWIAARAKSIPLGVSVGTAICVGFIVAPEALGSAKSPIWIAALPEWTHVAIGFIATLLPLAGLLRLDWRWLRVPLAPLLAVGLLAGILASNAWTESGGPNTAAFAAKPSGGGPNILLLILDTVRADHLSLYGYERRTTPELERHLRVDDGAAVFPFAFSTSNWTIPSHVSLLTGLLASEHQSHLGNGVGQLDLKSEGWSVELDETLGQRLAEAGYRTAGVIANPFLMALDGPGRGFDLWTEAPRPATFALGAEALRRKFFRGAYLNQYFPTATATAVNRVLLELFDHCEEGGCFIMANYMEAHTPYTPSTPYAGTFSEGAPASVPDHLNVDDSPMDAVWATAAYDEQILELDAHLGELLDELEARGLLDEMWLFITSDHGESFQEHQSVRHASNLYNDQVRIPLVVQPPRGSRLAVTQPAGLLDVTATISAIATGRPLGHGRDLRSVDAPAIARMEFFGSRSSHSKLGVHSRLDSRGVVRGDRKLIEIGGRRELYLLESDPAERSDLASARPEEAARLARDLPPLEIRSDRIRIGNDAFDSDTIDALRALGYAE